MYPRGIRAHKQWRFQICRTKSGRNSLHTYRRPLALQSRTSEINPERRLQLRWRSEKVQNVAGNFDTKLWPAEVGHINSGGSDSLVLAGSGSTSQRRPQAGSLAASCAFRPSCTRVLIPNKIGLAAHTTMFQNERPAVSARTY